MNAIQKEILRKRRILENAEACRNVNKACRYLGVSHLNLYLWQVAFRRHGDAGLIVKKPIPKSHPNRTSTEVIEKVLRLRQKYHLGPIRIVWYLQHYHATVLSLAFGDDGIQSWCTSRHRCLDPILEFRDESHFQR